MINTLRPGATQGHDSQRGEVLERIQKEYGKPDEKQREAVKKLGKDEFFKIMVTQIQHQDPLKPYQNEQMAAEMAQFTALEQMMNVNSNLEKLAQAQLPLQNMGAAHLIGKFVTADSSRLSHTEGRYSDVNFDLPADAAKVHVTILNDRGENIREIETNNIKKGEAKISWDGKQANNMAAKGGQYLVQISAVTEEGKPIQVQTQRTEIVHGVAFEGKETVLLTGEISKPQKILLKNVYKIVDKSDINKASAQPQISGLPPGMQIEGLESLFGQGVADGQSDVEGGPQEGTQDKMMEDYHPQTAGKYMPVDTNAFNKGQEKPVIQPALSNQEIRELLTEVPDLTGANPVAAAVKEGKAPPRAKPSGERNMDDVNPAARDHGYKDGSLSAQRQSVPSGGDGSVAGKWTE